MYNNKLTLIFADDIPIQIAKEETGVEGKSNLKSITEDQEVAETNRPGSVRQPKDTKVGSKMTNFSGLGKKVKEREGKFTQRNSNVSASEKDKKIATQQGALKENTRASRSLLNIESGDAEASVSGTRKKILIVENSSIVDANTSLIDSERLAASGEGLESINLDSAVSLTRYNDPESGASSIQVSSV